MYILSFIGVYKKRVASNISIALQFVFIRAIGGKNTSRLYSTCSKIKNAGNICQRFTGILFDLLVLSSNHFLHSLHNIRRIQAIFGQ